MRNGTTGTRTGALGRQTIEPRSGPPSERGRGSDVLPPREKAALWMDGRGGRLFSLVFAYMHVVTAQRSHNS